MDSLTLLILLLVIAALIPLVPAHSVGCYLVIENRTPENFSKQVVENSRYNESIFIDPKFSLSLFLSLPRTYAHAYQMDRWIFPETLLSQKATIVLAEFNHGPLRDWKDDGGDADYALAQNLKFRIQASHEEGPEKNEPGLTACTTNEVSCSDDRKIKFNFVKDGYFHLLLEKNNGSVELRKGDLKS